jgi:hypothetical protein
MGRQVVRSPDEVLWAPWQATCLDLAVILAARCLKAGLHPDHRHPRPTR